jgi:23S rRNA (adenine2503-C2)-methyltransferase
LPTPTDLRSFTPAQLIEFFGQLGLPAARARQVFALVQRPGVHDVAEMTAVSKEVRGLLAGRARISRLMPAQVLTSRDGTVKFAFRLEDGAVIESVLIPGDGRHTLCVSSQAGCAMGCRFCLTAGLGFRRNLTPAEIVNQVLAVQEHMIRGGVVRPTTRQLIDNLVFMGMGEPLANYDNLVAALTILMDNLGQGFSERRVTVSTCGLVPGIRRLGRDIRVNLAISLHAVDDALRSTLMPVNRSYGVDELLAACREYPLGGRRIIFFECVLIEGLNDSPDDARRLAGKLRGIPCRVNLLQFNETPALPYRCSPPASVQAFKDILHQAGFRALVRNSRGADICAACGQLACGALRGDLETREEPPAKDDLRARGSRAKNQPHLNGRP